jgi:hypothetical protein
MEDELSSGCCGIDRLRYRFEADLPVVESGDRLNEVG